MRIEAVMERMIGWYTEITRAVSHDGQGNPSDDVCEDTRFLPQTAETRGDYQGTLRLDQPIRELFD
jgi:hypothetical protein